MSFEAMTWAMKQPVGNPIGKIILLIVANYADQYGKCFPGQKRLAADCECGERSVREWLSVFEEKGLISRTERRRSSGYRTSDEIQLNMPELPAADAGEVYGLAAPDAVLTGSTRRTKLNLSEESKKAAPKFDPTEKWVKLDRQVDAELWLACERLQGKKAPTSDLHWKFPLSLVERAKSTKEKVINATSH